MTPSDKKFIFLDIDGVLNSESYYTTRETKPTTREEHNIMSFDPQAIVHLNRIIEETGALIVVSSTWRQSRSIKELQQLLDNVGVISKVYSKTPVLREEYIFRGNEIEWWLQEEQRKDGKIAFTMLSPYKYVILDDDFDMLLHQAPYFVKCNYKTGLTETLANEAIKILNNEKT